MSGERDRTIDDFVDAAAVMEAAAERVDALLKPGQAAVQVLKDWRFVQIAGCADTPAGCNAGRPKSVDFSNWPQPEAITAAIGEWRVACRAAQAKWDLIPAERRKHTSPRPVFDRGTNELGRV